MTLRPWLEITAIAAAALGVFWLGSSARRATKGDPWRDLALCCGVPLREGHKGRLITNGPERMKCRHCGHVSPYVSHHDFSLQRWLKADSAKRAAQVRSWQSRRKGTGA